MGEVVVRFPLSFENRVEMLQHIATLSREKSQLEQEVARKESLVAEQVVELEQFSNEKKQLEQEVARKELIVKSKNEYIDQLVTEKKQIKQEADSKIENVEVACSAQIQQFETENIELRSGLRAAKELLHAQDSRISELCTQCAKFSEEVEQQISNVSARQEETNKAAAQISQLKAELDTLKAKRKQEKLRIQIKETEIARKDTMLAAGEQLLRMKEATIDFLNKLVTTGRQFIRRKPQVMALHVHVYTVESSACA